MKKEEKKVSRKKGEAGFWERNTDAAHAAAARASAIFPDEEEFTAVANAYFDECDRKDLLYGEAGLCLALSRGNKKGLSVSLKTLRGWYDGESCAHLQDAVQNAYLRIQEQVETDLRYQSKTMCSRGMFLQKQARFGGYQDRIDTKNDTTVKITFGSGVEKSDFE